MSDKRPTRRVSVGIPVEIAQWATDEAKRLGMSRSQFATLLFHRERDFQMSERLKRIEERVNLLSIALGAK